MTSTTPDEAPLWLLTSMSGAGRSTALAALREAGVACTDDLPIALLAPAAGLARRGSAVVSVDARQGSEAAELVPPDGVRVVFLDADDSTLVRRLADSTMPHPCAAAGGGLAAVAAERALLAGLRGVADAVVDTSALTPGELGARIVELIAPGGAGTEGEAFALTVSSFGFKFGPQIEADWVVDVRFLPNPFWKPELRPLTGLDPMVSGFVLDADDGRELLDQLAGLLSWVCDRAAARGRRRLHVAIGCTGGRHRSVAVAEALGRRVGGDGLRVGVRHRDVDKPDPR